MNPKRQIIQQAIMDLEENKEMVRQIYEEWRATKEGPGYYTKVQKLDDAMKKARQERMNIAVRIFYDYTDNLGNPIAGDPNESFYDPSPTPVFSVRDFRRGPMGMPRTSPMITGASTIDARNGDRTLDRIDKFIEQLKRKMRTRKDLQESSPFQLTEAKLKQMILEAIKNKRLQNFGIPTPDDNLRSQLGDEMFDKIQAADPEQSEIFKQSFDPNYPSRSKQETFEDLLKPFGFKEAASKLVSHRGVPKRIKAYDAYISDPNDSDRLYVDYRVLSDDLFPDEPYIRYRASLWSEKEKDNVWEAAPRFGHKSIEFPYKIIDLEIESDEGDRAVESIILAKEKENILAALEELT